MSQDNILILPSTYFGPVQYFSKIQFSSKVLIEQYDTYARQTYRNRCIIMNANGKLPLSIPVKKVHGNKTKMIDILIDYDTNWQKDHKQGIISAYKSSPFFEFYFDDYLWLFNKRNKFLIDLNLRLTEIILSQLQIKSKIELSGTYTAQPPKDDLREIINPKRSLTDDWHFRTIHYVQVFSAKHGFIPNLSIIDLLFNTGPEASGILKQTFIP